MRAVVELRDPIGIVLAVATAAVLLLLQEGPAVALLGGAGVLAVRVVSGLLVLEWRSARVPAGRAEHHHPLSRREAEIAELVARGLTNREIADQLVLSERTVDNHVFHIMNKLGFHHRTEIGVWLTERRMKELHPRR
jgi:DNA-binding NarL/FixJ family response regulator